MPDVSKGHIDFSCWNSSLFKWCNTSFI